MIESNCMCARFVWARFALGAAGLRFGHVVPAMCAAGVVSP